eukprot:6194545-Pleurochrysis_carterae.AAC.4
MSRRWCRRRAIARRRGLVSEVGATETRRGREVLQIRKLEKGDGGVRRTGKEKRQGYKRGEGRWAGRQISRPLGTGPAVEHASRWPSDEKNDRRVGSVSRYGGRSLGLGVLTEVGRPARLGETGRERRAGYGDGARPRKKGRPEARNKGADPASREGIQGEAPRQGRGERSSATRLLRLVFVLWLAAAELARVQHEPDIGVLRLGTRERVHELGAQLGARLRREVARQLEPLDLAVAVHRQQRAAQRLLLITDTEQVHLETERVELQLQLLRLRNRPHTAETR